LIKVPINPEPNNSLSIFWTGMTFTLPFIATFQKRKQTIKSTNYKEGAPQYAYPPTAIQCFYKLLLLQCESEGYSLNL